MDISNEVMQLTGWLDKGDKHGTTDLNDPNLLQSPDKLSGLSESELFSLRGGKYKDNPEAQATLAPYEHKAWIRNYIRERPETAGAFLGLVPAYQMAKAFGPEIQSILGITDQAATSPSTEQLKMGLLGVVEGLTGAGTDAAKKMSKMFESAINTEHTPGNIAEKLATHVASKFSKDGTQSTPSKVPYPIFTFEEKEGKKVPKIAGYTNPEGGEPVWFSSPKDIKKPE